MSTFAASLPSLQTVIQRCGDSSAGRWLITKVVCRAAPFFQSINPRFLTLEPGLVVVALPDRRAVRNHLGSVHAIAMCNAAELAAGTCLELTRAPALRWIPVGMEVTYTRIARGDLTATCDLRGLDLTQEGTVKAPVTIVDKKGEVVFTADISMRLSPRKKKS